ncbi:hypothetical protein ACM55G_12695 [Flavobacterium sp. LB3P122]|uniref:bestrophin-like domain n=1 Tax=Flavobacterium algoriphilum TaxID=3398738 RepID=UPI003A84342C
MTTIQYLLNLPSVLFFILMSFFGAFIGGFSTFIFRKYKPIKIMKSHNEVTGFIFLAIASFYSLLMSFVLFLVWDQFNDTYSNVSKEGNFALGLYRDIKFYPDSAESKQLMTPYLDFVNNVIHEEFPNMENTRPSPKTKESLNDIFYKMERLNPKNQFQIQLVAEMYNHLNQLDLYRGLRISSKDTEISPPLWLPMILGGIIIIICGSWMDIKNARMHIILNCLIGLFIGMLFFSIILLDNPFVGTIRIKPVEYKSILTLEQPTKQSDKGLHQKK